MAEEGSRSRSETEQLNQSPQERVRNRFPGRSRTLSGQEPQEERTEQELQQNENNDEENTDESNETFNINENDFFAIESTDVGIHDAYNEEGGGGVGVHQPRRGRNHNICGNTFYANKGERVGISKVGNKYNNNSSLPFLLSLLVLLVIASSVFFYISMVSKQNKK